MLMIENTDQRSKDYGDIAQSYRPGHADFTHIEKYGIREITAAVAVHQRVRPHLVLRQVRWR